MEDRDETEVGGKTSVSLFEAVPLVQVSTASVVFTTALSCIPLRALFMQSLEKRILGEANLILVEALRKTHSCLQSSASRSLA